MYVYVNKNNTNICIQHTIKDYGKHIANVSISHVQNIKYICISVENRHYDQNTEIANLDTHVNTKCTNIS